jgi:hypothetical protein
MSLRNVEEDLKNKNTEWGNLAGFEEEEKKMVNNTGPMASPVSPKSPDYNESTPRPGNAENIERNKRSYDRYLERMGLPPRPNKTPSPRSRHRRSPSPRSRHRRSPSPVRRHTRHYRRPSRSRSPSPVRRYTRHYRRHSRSRSPSPARRYTRHYRHRRSQSRSPRHRRSPSPRRRSPRRRSPSPVTRYQNGRRVNASGREVAYGPPMATTRFPSVNTPEGPVSPPRYETRFTENGRRVNEFGRNVAYGPPRAATRRANRTFNEVTRTYRPSNFTRV